MADQTSGPVEIKIKLDVSSAKAELARMKTKVQQGQGGPAQTPGAIRPDSGRVAEVERALDREREERLKAGGGVTSFLTDAAHGGFVKAGARSFFAAAESGEFGGVAAGAARFAGGAARQVGQGVAIFQILDAITTNMAVLAPIITKHVLDQIQQQFPWLPRTMGMDTAQLVEDIAEFLQAQLDRIKTTGAAAAEAIGIQKAGLALGADIDLEEAVSDFAKIQKAKENKAKVDRAARQALTNEALNSLEKQLLGGAR